MNEENKEKNHTIHNPLEKVPTKANILKKPWVQSLVSFVVIFGLLGIFLFWQIEESTVFIENSNIEAPIINLAPSSAGVLNALYVKEGDTVAANSQVALVGSQIISTKDGGTVASAPVVLGSYFSAGETVVSIVNVAEMKVVGQIEENKGLNKIKRGQRATFSVDAFPGHTYEGVVDSISQTSDSTGIVFSISDKRPTEKFDVKVRFNIADYPELKSGMSAKITVYIK
jgi:multidrug resistance efflux pump